MIFKHYDYSHLLYEKDKSSYNKRRVVGGGLKKRYVEQDLWGSVSVLSR